MKSIFLSLVLASVAYGQDTYNLLNIMPTGAPPSVVVNPVVKTIAADMMVLGMWFPQITEWTGDGTVWTFPFHLIPEPETP